MNSIVVMMYYIIYIYCVILFILYICTYIGIAHKLRHPTVSMSFLNDVGDIINVPSQHYVCESSVNVGKSSNVTNVSGMYIHTYIHTICTYILLIVTVYAPPLYMCMFICRYTYTYSRFVFLFTTVLYITVGHWTFKDQLRWNL